MQGSLVNKIKTLLLALLAGSSTWAQVINGLVVDAKTAEPMSGVAIVYNKSQNLGVVTDLNGLFTIPDRTLIDEVTFRFIGYEPRTFTASQVPSTDVWVVHMQAETATLEEVEVLAGENPALRIVRNAIANRTANNPRFYKSYSYLSYNKDVISYKLELPDSAVSQKDSLQFARDTARAKERHLMVLESVTKKWFKSPNKAKEIVIGTKISGFNHPNVATIPDAVQNFGFHENIIPLVDKKFLNPLADGADKRYVYILKDTLYTRNDTTFVMDYFPERGANFEGFIGEMHITTRNWALIKVTAYPFDAGKINLYIAQEYALINEAFWFPVRMNYSLNLERMPFRQTGAVMSGSTFLDSINIGLEIPDDRFDHVEVDVQKRAGFVADDFWETYRKESLSIQEQETYRHMDSLGERYQLDALLKATRHAYEGFIALGKVDVEVSKLVAYNDYEGLRLGVGLYTNEDVSTKYLVGGYVGHGTIDKQWKYGATLRWYFNKVDDVYITANYLNDVRDPGGIRIKYKEWGNVSQQFFNKLMDRVEESALAFNFRVGTYSKFAVGMRHFSLRPTYAYTFLGDGITDINARVYRFSEAQLWYRWQYKEKFSRNYGQRISQGSKWPIVNIIYSRGINNLIGSQFAYNKLEVGVFYERFTRNLGKTRVAVEAGIIDQPLPWSMNFSGRPSYNPSFSVVVKETFQTMRFNEFSSNRYWSLFFMHDFGPLLLRFKRFKPEFRLVQAISFGALHSPELHLGVPFKTLENGYFESGAVLDNIIRFNVFNTGYLGVGVGAFYRYGANHLPVESENWAFKIAFMYSVN